MAGKVTVDYKEYVKKMNEAETAKDMVMAWRYACPEGVAEPEEYWKDCEPLVGVYVDKAPQIIKYFVNQPFGWILEHGPLEPKVKELIIIAVLVGMRAGGLIKHVSSAIGQGATEEEVMEAVHLALYELGKAGLAEAGPAIKKGFAQAAKASYKTD
jgi:alkylhydroperoxidase/carboxymuconolactone decarboxylase family protein YurZ